MRALVTGHRGFIGGHLFAELERQGWEVYGADIKEGINLAWTGSHLWLPDVDVVFHLAAFTGVRASVQEPAICQYYNVMATVNLLEWAQRKGVKRFVFASSSSVYGDSPTRFLEEQETRPMSPYAASKVAGEALCHAYHRLYGMNVTALRYFTVYGPSGRKDMAVGKFIEALRNDRPIIIYGDGSQRRDFTYVGDVVKATIAAVSWDGWNMVNVGYGGPVSILNILNMLCEAMGKHNIPINYEPANPADVPVTWANTEKLERLMDWQPKPLREGLRLTVEGER